MASATSVAVTMLNCSSSTSPPGHGVSAISSISPDFFGFNFASSNNLTVSSSQSHPTVILDLTAPNHKKKLISSTLFSAPHSSPTSLNFSSSNSNFDINNALQIGLENRFPNIKSVASPYSRPALYTSQKQTIDRQKIAAATKAITCDPTFESALATAIKSFVGINNVQGKSSGLNFHLNFSKPSSNNGSIGCVTSFLNKLPQTVNFQQKSLTNFAPLTLSTSKFQAMSLADDGEQIKLL